MLLVLTVDAVVLNEVSRCYLLVCLEELEERREHEYVRTHKTTPTELHWPRLSTMASLSPIDTTNWVAPLVMQYLGVRSLVRFASLNSQLRAFVAVEVTRRKNVIRAAQEQVNELLAISDDALPTCNAVMTAKNITAKARGLIDNELHWLEREESPGAEVDTLFAEERRNFQSGHFMLPRCFYLLHDEEILLPNDEDEKRELLADAENNINQILMLMRGRSPPTLFRPPIVFNDDGYSSFRFPESLFDGGDAYFCKTILVLQMRLTSRLRGNSGHDEVLARIVCRRLATERRDYIPFLYFILGVRGLASPSIPYLGDANHEQSRKSFRPT